jgi:lipopolysaccharide export system protein LptA
LSCRFSLSRRVGARGAATQAKCAAVCWGVPEDADQPINIRADTAELDETKGLAIYRGSVQLDQGTLRVTADTMTIELVDQKVVRITAEGNLAHYQQQLNPDEETVRADAETIIYHTQAERVELIGQAYLTENDNEFRGTLIEYDMRAGKVNARATEGRVEMILSPAERATE